MNARQVISLLDRTIQWYRTQRAGRDSASRPSDWLILSENSRIARQIVTLTFAIARTDAQMIGAGATPAAGAAAGTPAAGLYALKTRLIADQVSLKAELAAARSALPRARGKQRADLRAKISELQGERDLTDARMNIIATMVDFIGTSDAFGSSAHSLKTQIDAMALALPQAAQGVPAAAARAAAAARRASSAGGLWELAHEVWQVGAKEDQIEAMAGATVAVQHDFAKARTPLFSRVKALAARGDALAAFADSADAATLGSMRPQLDGLASQFRQLAGLLIPFGKVNVLFLQYRANLHSWHDAVDREYDGALTALGVHLGILALVLGAVFVGAEFWKRAVFRYSHDHRRRHQLLLVRDIVLWCLVVVIIGISFASELGSVATFAGLITAGVAVAMQSVLVSIVGYFFLIGKYGIRVGDRVQIGEVTGEVIHLGLVRLQLLEIGSQGRLGPTGRVVAFANSIVFQVAGGLFKQIHGVDMSWHEIKLTLPDGADPVASKARLLDAVNDALADYRGEIERQAAEIQQATASKSADSAEPRVQLHFGPTAVEALVRYPVHLPQAAEIDERVSKELIRALGPSAGPVTPTAPAAPAAPTPSTPST